MKLIISWFLLYYFPWNLTNPNFLFGTSFVLNVLLVFYDNCTWCYCSNKAHQEVSFKIYNNFWLIHTIYGEKPTRVTIIFYHPPARMPGLQAIIFIYWYEAQPANYCHKGRPGPQAILYFECPVRMPRRVTTISIKNMDNPQEKPQKYNYLAGLLPGLLAGQCPVT